MEDAGSDDMLIDCLFLGLRLVLAEGMVVPLEVLCCCLYVDYLCVVPTRSCMVLCAVCSLAVYTHHAVVVGGGAGEAQNAKPLAREEALGT